MKAAVIYQKGQLPYYADVPDPVPQNGDEILVKVRAVAIKHFDKGRAEHRHYSSPVPSAVAGKIIGSDGVCLTSDGARVYAIGTGGMLAENAVVDKDRTVAIPEAVDDITAAALPNAVIGAAMGLRFKAGIKPGDVVLVNGATGFTGRVAVQLARHYGAGKVIATGRNLRSLNELLDLGADEVVPVTADDDLFISRVRAIHQAAPVDVIIDYLWGHTAEMIFCCLKGNGSFTNNIRYVSVGSVTGDMIQLSAANLRSVDIKLTGSGLGAWTKQQVGLLFSEILPEMFLLSAEGKLKVDTIEVRLKDIAELWDVDVPNGRRLVVTV